MRRTPAIYKSVVGGVPKWHLKVDALELLKMRWDMVIAFPPCTHLAVSGARHFEKKRADGRQQQAIKFFMAFANANCDRIAIENPIGIMSKVWKRPSQIIQPYQFGHEARKATCLWLKGLPKLKPTEIVSPGEIKGAGFSVGASTWAAKDENGKTIAWNDPRTAIIRSKTFPGIAKAMAEQWAGENREPAYVEQDLF